MRSVFSVPSPTAPYRANGNHHDVNTVPKPIHRGIADAAINSDGVKEGSFSIATLPFSIKRLVIASPYQWE
jgi:hypothetical protein